MRTLLEYWARREHYWKLLIGVGQVPHIYIRGRFCAGLPVGQGPKYDNCCYFLILHQFLVCFCSCRKSRKISFFSSKLFAGFWNPFFFVLSFNLSFIMSVFWFFPFFPHHLLVSNLFFCRYFTGFTYLLGWLFIFSIFHCLCTIT